ncbi:hypothetical protein PIB30_000785 [Stylosanthes scabra]|uniref:Uncharacterized protein n=1 Tax=Stylosanthes scabra TaxID=79078 RepID=A0ABU6Q273_9FABA|nr:hypothetical protein [Stylosanthes scabra]
MVGGHYSSFKVLIVANIGPIIRSLAKVVIGGETFTIFVREVGLGRIDIEDVVPYQKEPQQTMVRNVAMEPGESNNGENNAEPIAETLVVTSIEEEDEGSKVGETQPAREERNNDTHLEEAPKSPNGPTAQLVTNEGIGPKGAFGNPFEAGSTSISIPPGFERPDFTDTASKDAEREGVRTTNKSGNNGGRRHMKKVLKLNDQLKEKARKLKEARKQRT